MDTELWHYAFNLLSAQKPLPGKPEMSSIYASKVITKQGMSLLALGKRSPILLLAKAGFITT